ncbi:DNA/RNA polymerases superfamily protein, putative isoform 2 [Theobroma cacao]|nr:DNA/RNA polymerases superfamily protein, putative isoform 2 [Theobroma cacao]
MPPRTRAMARDTLEQDALNDASARPLVDCSKDHGKGGRPTKSTKAEPPRTRPADVQSQVGGDHPVGGATLDDVVAELKGVNRVLEVLANEIIDQRQRDDGHLTVQAPSSSHGQDEQQHFELAQGSVVVTLSEFLELKPPLFSGFDSSKDPQQFLDDMEKVCGALGSSGTRSVELVSFKLKDVAQIWFESFRRGRSLRSTPLTWEEFSVAFMDRSLPASVRYGEAREFEVLVQTRTMSVSEYDIRFTQLSRYAPYLVPTEEMKVKRFVDGLVWPLFRAIGPQRFDSYSSAVDCARRIEMRSVESCVAHVKTKKARMEGHQVCSDSSTSPVHDQRTFSPLRQQFSEQGSQFIAPCPTCGKRYRGQCLLATSTCYSCGQVGHVRKNCPRSQHSEGPFHGFR